MKKIKRYKYVITFIIVLIILFLCVIRKNNLKEINKEYSINNIDSVLAKETNEFIDNPEDKIKVDIKGQVNNPGVYELNKGTRIIDVISMAGGLTDNANTNLINLSKILEDEMVIIIYSNEEVLNSNVKEVETVFKVIEKECNCPNIKNDGCVNTELDSNLEKNDIININTASIEELMTLPSIGEAKAKEIIEYRKENKFNSIEEIKNVSGIGDALFEKIKEYISV